MYIRNHAANFAQLLRFLPEACPPPPKPLFFVNSAKAVWDASIALQYEMKKKNRISVTHKHTHTHRGSVGMGDDGSFNVMLLN